MQKKQAKKLLIIASDIAQSPKRIKAQRRQIQPERHKANGIKSASWLFLAVTITLGHMSFLLLTS